MADLAQHNPAEARRRLAVRKEQLVDNPVEATEHHKARLEFGRTLAAREVVRRTAAEVGIADIGLVEERRIVAEEDSPAGPEEEEGIAGIGQVGACCTAVAADIGPEEEDIVRMVAGLLAAARRNLAEEDNPAGPEEEGRRKVVAAGMTLYRLSLVSYRGVGWSLTLYEV